MLAGVGPIVFGIIYRNTDVVESLDMSTIFMITAIALGSYVVLFSICGICGACKANRYCLCWVGIAR